MNRECIEERRKLRLIEALQPIFSSINLNNTLMICVQHLCSTTEVLFRSLFKLCLKPKNLYVLGKCYSTNPEVLNRLKISEVNALPSSCYFNNDIPFDLNFDRNVDEMLKLVSTSHDLYSFERIILLDDGGHLLEKSNECLPKDIPIIGIEQTSSGFNRLSGKDIRFPIINLARSWLKLEHESPIIINLILRKLNEKLSVLKNKINKLLLIGNGVIGQEIYKNLNDKYLISIFDSIPEKSMISSIDFIEKLQEFDLIIGCTGTTSLTFDNFKFLKKPVVLASVSSSDREFEAYKFRKLKPGEHCHCDITIGGITLLNSGFPISFDRDYDSIDTDDFQLTRALILASVYQASQNDLSIHGFLPMRDDLQERVLNQLEYL